MKRWKAIAALVFVVVCLGVVGRMDYDDAVRHQLEVSK